MVALEKLRCVSVHFTVCTVIFFAEIVKITVHTVKCFGTHRNFSNATMNSPSVTRIFQVPFFPDMVTALSKKLNLLYCDSILGHLAVVKYQLQKSKLAICHRLDIRPR